MYIDRINGSQSEMCVRDVRAVEPTCTPACQRAYLPVSVHPWLSQKASSSRDVLCSRKTTEYCKNIKIYDSTRDSLFSLLMVNVSTIPMGDFSAKD